MEKPSFWLLLSIVLILSCKGQKNSSLSAFEVYCEMVANDAKPMALHNPMASLQVDKIWNDLQEIAEKYQVQLFRENDFPVSMLFPAELTKGKTVVVIYKGHRLKQYEQWKADLQEDDGTDLSKSKALARRFGRLMGYGSAGINDLLGKITAYKNLALFKVIDQVTHLYYPDIAKATDFYSEVLGLKKISSTKFQISKGVYIQLHPLDENHTENQPKSVAIALLTNQLADWYGYIQEKKVPVKYTYKPRDGGPHDGFVAIDPGGYLLEFEQFKQHPENELFMAVLAKAPRISTSINGLNFFGSITWTYHKDLLRMQEFYEEILGYQLVADQGWTKIYQTTSSGFIGLVDECRGMEDYADTKPVEIEWIIDEKELFESYAQQYWNEYEYNNDSFLGPENYIYRISENP